MMLAAAGSLLPASGAALKTSSGETLTVDFKGWIVCRHAAADIAGKSGYVLVEGATIAAVDHTGLRLAPDNTVITLVHPGLPNLGNFAAIVEVGKSLPVGQTVNFASGAVVGRVTTGLVALPIEGGYYPDPRKPRYRPELETSLVDHGELFQNNLLEPSVFPRIEPRGLLTGAGGDLPAPPPPMPGLPPAEVEAALGQAIAAKPDLIILRLPNHRYLAVEPEPIKAFAGNRVELKRGRAVVTAMIEPGTTLEPQTAHDLMRAALASGYTFNLGGFSGGRGPVVGRGESFEVAEVLPYRGPPEPAVKKGWDNYVVRIAGGMGHFKHGMMSQPVVEIAHRSRTFKPKRTYATLLLEPLANAGATGLPVEQEAAFLARFAAQKNLRVVTDPAAAGPEGVLVARPRLYATNDIVVVGYAVTDRQTGEVMDWAHGWGWLRPDARDKDLLAFADTCGVTKNY
jgi:hypothetical protein